MCDHPHLAWAATERKASSGRTDGRPTTMETKRAHPTHTHTGHQPHPAHLGLHEEHPEAAPRHDLWRGGLCDRRGILFGVRTNRTCVHSFIALSAAPLTHQSNTHAHVTLTPATISASSIVFGTFFVCNAHTHTRYAYAAGVGGGDCDIVTDCLGDGGVVNTVRVALALSLLVTHPVYRESTTAAKEGGREGGRQKHGGAVHSY